jgi:hypothetical protein
MKNLFVLLVGTLFTIACQPVEKEADGPTSDSALTSSELADIIGSIADGWEPVALRGLKSGMSPAEAAAVISGADVFRDSQPVARIDLTDTRGLSGIKLQYAGENFEQYRLAYGSVIFSTEASSRPGFFSDLLDACRSKYGEPTSSSDASEQVTWRDELGYAQLLADGRYLEPRYYVLTVGLQAP